MIGLTAQPYRIGSNWSGRLPAMNIVVCVKQVPDSWAEKKLNPADNTLDREATDAVVNELDEFAIEEALQLQERLGWARVGHGNRPQHGPGEGAGECPQGFADGGRQRRSRGRRFAARHRRNRHVVGVGQGD